MPQTDPISDQKYISRPCRCCGSPAFGTRCAACIADGRREAFDIKAWTAAYEERTGLSRDAMLARVKMRDREEFAMGITELRYAYEEAAEAVDEACDEE